VGETIKSDAVDPVMDAAPTVTIEGREYRMRRLGLRDVFRVSRILGRGVSMLADAGKFTVGQIVQVLVGSITVNEDEVLDLIADVLQVERVELNDPERFPMPCVLDVLEALAKHQDLMGFIVRVQALTERLPETTTP
jgi:hypothetical protein